MNSSKANLYTDNMKVELHSAPDIVKLAFTAAISFVDPHFPGLNRNWSPHCVSVNDIAALWTQLKAKGPDIVINQMKGVAYTISTMPALQNGESK